MPTLQKRLTDTVAKSLPPPAKGYEIYWCGATNGLGVRVMQNGLRAWVFERRVDGHTVRRTLGRVAGSGRNAITAEAARSLLLETSNELAQGIDALAEQREANKQERESGITFAEALRQYVNDNGSRKSPLKERTKSDYLDMVRAESVGDSGRTRVEGELASIAQKRLDVLTGSGVKALYKSLQSRGPTRAAYAMRVLRGVLNFHGVQLADDPFARTTPGRSRIRLPSANKRHRVIPAEALHAWWKAAGSARNGDFFQLLLLTGLRRGELSAVKISDVNLAGGRIVIADTKGGKPHTVMLSQQARKIVAKRAVDRLGYEPLYEQASDPRKSLKGIIKASGVKFSAHDCRRTFGSIAASLLPGYVVKRLMNHADGGDVTAGHYVHLDETTMRSGWQNVADFVTKQPAPKQSKAGRKKTSVPRRAI